MAKASSKEESSEPLKYQTWVLKVPIHCEGCKKKVRKILQSIDGIGVFLVCCFLVNGQLILRVSIVFSACSVWRVYETKIEAQNRVVVTGNVSPDTLIKKLQKQNKHAELWPEKKDAKPAKSGGDKKEKGSKGGDNGNGSEKKASPAVASKNAADGEKKSAAAEASSDSKSAKSSEESAKQSNTQAKESKETEHLPAENPSQSPAVENSGSGGGGKKKKKGQKADNAGGGAGPAIVNSGGGEESSARMPAGGPTPASPPRQHPTPPYGYGYPPPPQHQPVYVTSYHTAHPSMSYGGAYYAAPPAYYAHHHVEAPEHYPAPSSGSSYEMFSDENPNGCSVM
ncbi:hypothetical protein ACLOJK_026140 [Asimina triloba]